MSLLPQSTMAANEALLQILLDNGAITQEQYGQLLEKEKLTAKEFQDIKVSVGKKGLRAETADGQFSFKIGGRLHAQAAGHRGRLASEATNGTELRRARFDLESTVYELWRWKAEVDFADNDVSVKDFLVGYTGFEWGNLFAGNQKQPYSLALEMSSNDLPFIERGIDTDLLVPFVDRAIGLRADSAGEHWQISGGIFGSSVNPEKTGNEGWGAATRLVYAPIRDDNRVLHLGARAAYRQPSNEETRIRAETAHLSNLFTVNTGTLQRIDNALLFGPELAFAWGPFSIGGEYNRAMLQRGGGDDLTFNSWHVAATWSITGESRASTYKMGSGEFKRLQPAVPFSLNSGGRGAWELALRYASIDLDDEEINGGEQQSMTMGLNWYLNANTRLMLDWSRILDTGSANRRAEDLDIFQTRVQFAF
jgi:phosphate-selective porin OprO/OprP